MRPFIDPRDGDIEADASSAKNRSMLSLAGSLIAEISLPKLVVAWFVLLGFPALLVGALPIAAAIWLEVVWRKLDTAIQGVIPAALLVIILAIGLLAGRRLFRLAERSFWSLNSLAVQPAYALCRELLNQVGDRFLPDQASQSRRAAWRSATAAIAGGSVCLGAIGIMVMAYPHTLVAADFAGLSRPLPLILGAVANSITIVAGYVAIGAIAWGFADATMPPTRDYSGFAASGSTSAGTGCRWRIAHLSDLHTIGERFGFRIESGRNGPRGNDRLRRAFAILDDLHAKEPLDAILITGDITDAGLSSEWAEFMAALDAFPRIKPLILLIPGNHDINVVNRSNPAQFDLPTSPYKKLRKIRLLSALQAVQGTRVHVVDRPKQRIGTTLDAALAPHLPALAGFADSGRPRWLAGFDRLWADLFPMILPPTRDDGLGVILMNSNADAHFSFTNALGMVGADQVIALENALAQYPQAGWIVCLHHHMIEYPRRADALSERIGTALINGQWFVRRLQRHGPRLLVLHGHRHVDWFGECGTVPIMSAPSTVMGDEHGKGPRFYIHTLETGPQGGLKVHTPQAITVNATPAAQPAG